MHRWEDERWGERKLHKHAPRSHGERRLSREDLQEDGDHDGEEDAVRWRQ